MSKVSKGLEKAGVVGASATLLGGAGSALLLALAASPAAASATWTVDTLADGVANASDCTIPVVDSCSLRDALAAAAAGDAIRFSAALFTGGAGTITLTDGQLLNNGVDVFGPGANLLTIDAAAASRIFELTPAPAGTIVSGVTLTNGYSGGDPGGAILVIDSNTLTVSQSVLSDNAGGSGGAVAAASLVLIDSEVSNNTSSDFGGGILVTDHLTVSNSTISDNAATHVGGGIALFGGSASLTVIDSTISGNTAEDGGGIGGDSITDSTSIANSTFTGNAASRKGGAISLAAPSLDISMSTITGNSSAGSEPSYSGGGIRFIATEYSAFTLTGSVVAGNTAGIGGFADILNGALTPEYDFVTVNNSLIGSGVKPDFIIVGEDVLRSDSPMLGALANNGGSTMTMVPLAGSPLIDAGPATIPVFVGNQFDQRGPGFPRVVGTMSDIGAVEIQALDPDPVVPAFTG